LSIRPWVTAFAALSFALKAALILLLLVPAMLSVPPAPPAVLGALFGAVMASTFVRSFLVRRLTSTELAVVQFWSITPLLIVLVASTLGLLPMLVLDQLAEWLHWSAGALRMLVLVTLTGSLISAAFVIWAFWRQLRSSLPSAAA